MSKIIYIDPSGGIAGDMFSAALISAGAEENVVIDGMLKAAKMLGEAEINVKKNDDGSSGLVIHFHSKHAHIKGEKAKEILESLFNDLGIKEKYRNYGLRVLDNLVQAEQKAHSENHFESDHFHFIPIGLVRSPYTHAAPNRPDAKAEGDFYLELFPKYEDGLYHLEEFTHIYVIAYLDKSVGYSLLVNPPNHDIQVGLFASRSPFRPNPIGLNVVEIKKIEKNKVYISPVDFLDNTPIIDIKPVIRSLDKVEGANNGWVNDKITMIEVKTDKTHNEKNPHHHHNDAFLHEAQDIIIDIIGAVSGMQSLNLDTKAFLLNPVSVGGGMVKFSHGKLPVPSPAPKIILEEFNIPYQKGPVDTELCTPTGAALLAGLEIEKIEKNKEFKKIGTSRGTKQLPVPPLNIYF